MRFEDLKIKKPLLNALNDLEYLYPTPIQEKAFPMIMSGRNIVGIAQTGTGKTFAYLLPLINVLPYSEQREPRVLILAPTRVLVVQIVNEIKKLTKYSSIRSAGVYGDTNINTQKQLVYDGLDILVATPGRLIDLTFTGVLRLKSIQKLVIDEVDEMLSLGLNSQLKSVIDLLPEKRQTLMFSATMSSEVDNFIEFSAFAPQKIVIHPHGTPIEKIEQSAYFVPNFSTKANLLELLLLQNDDLSKVLVFVNSKKNADRLFTLIDERFTNKIGVIHSNKAHNTRISALKQFQEGEYRILISTDIVARGMDISDVTHVVNFDIPDEAGDYIHRIGRTGRADKIGSAISFIKDTERESIIEIEKMMGKAIPTLALPSKLEISTTLFEDERLVKKGDKGFMPKSSKDSSKPKPVPNEKKEKNKKINLGGPKQRGKNYEKLKKANNSTKPKKTRF